MNEIAFHLGARPVLWGEAALAFAAFASLVLLFAMAWSLRRARRERSAEAAAAAERAREMDDKVAELARINPRSPAGCRPSPRCSARARAISPG